MAYKLGKSHWPESLDDEGVCTDRDEEPWENWSVVLHGSEAGDCVEEPQDIAKVLKSLGYALIKISDDGRRCWIKEFKL